MPHSGGSFLAAQFGFEFFANIGTCGKGIGWILLLNNGMYGTIRMHQEREYPTHVTGSQLKNPDFAALAQAYGYVGVRIHKTHEFEEVLLAAMARPVLEHRMALSFGARARGESLAGVIDRSATRILGLEAAA